MSIGMKNWVRTTVFEVVNGLYLYRTFLALCPQTTLENSL